MSYAQDTNGGNERFVRAAEKHGRDRKVLSALAIGNDDPAGVVGRYRMAADKLGTLKIRSVDSATAPTTSVNARARRSGSVTVRATRSAASANRRARSGSDPATAPATPANARASW